MHLFAKKAPHAKELLSDNDLQSFMIKAERLAKTEDSIRVFETGNYKDYGLEDGTFSGDKWSPKYFGGAVEFLCETFFEHFGARLQCCGRWNSNVSRDCDQDPEQNARRLDQNFRLHPDCWREN